MRAVIEVEGLSKQYQIALAKLLRHSARGPNADDPRAIPAQEIQVRWRHYLGLYDLSFQAMPGDVIGIIGAQRERQIDPSENPLPVTEPTTGRADLYGRVGSLLKSEPVSIPN